MSTETIAVLAGCLALLPIVLTVGLALWMRQQMYYQLLRVDVVTMLSGEISYESAPTEREAEWIHSVHGLQARWFSRKYDGKNVAELHAQVRLPQGVPLSVMEGAVLSVRKIGLTADMYPDVTLKPSLTSEDTTVLTAYLVVRQTVPVSVSCLVSPTLR